MPSELLGYQGQRYHENRYATVETRADHHLAVLGRCCHTYHLHLCRMNPIPGLVPLRVAQVMQCYIQKPRLIRRKMNESRLIRYSVTAHSNIPTRPQFCLENASRNPLKFPNRC